MKYRLGLSCGGMMEYEGVWELHDVREIEADSINEAKDKWAELTGTNKSKTWDPKNHRDWGFAVVEESAFKTEHGSWGMLMESDGYQSGT